jgi:LuxR family maltose regulon positive regulatory protein
MRAMLILTASDLRFTTEETADFLGDVIGFDLSAADVVALEERTEGWIAALQLAALSMRGRADVSGFVSAFTGTERHVFDYLAEEVLDRQPEDTREFLLRTSILDRLSGPLCDAVTGSEQGQPMLEKLERMNLLMVPLDDRRRWYRYHHLFSDFLRQRLRHDLPTMVPELHRRASGWHEDNGNEGEAIGHALAAGDFEQAAGMIERLGDSMMGRGNFPTLERLMMTLPEEIVRSRPSLYLWYVALVLMQGNRWPDAELALRDIERMLGLGGEGSDEVPMPGSTETVESEELGHAAGDVATMRANIAYEGHGDLPKAIALNRRGLDLLAGDEWRTLRGIPANNLVECLVDIGDLPAAEVAIEEAQISHAIDYPADIMWTLIHRGRLLTIQGRLSEARKTYERILRLTAEHDEVGLLLDTGVAHVRMGELLFEWNDLEEATRHLLDGIERTLEWVGLGEATSRLLESTETHDRLDRLGEVDADAAHGVVPGYIALARVRLAQGDAQGALDALAEVERVAQNSRVSPLWRDRTERWKAAWQARLWMAEGDLRAAKRWSQDRDLGATDDPDYSSELEYITLARLLLAQGKLEEAADLLGRLIDAAEAGGRRRTVIELLVLQALVLRAQNDEPGALAALDQALLLAEPEGYVRTFADEGEPMADLLKRLLKAWRKERPNDAPLEYVNKLLEALGAGMTAPAKAQIRGQEGLILDPITGRELEVLRLLDSELSNREIAGRLFVSLDTVKSHTKHLYAKLGVHTRHQAVARARDLDLL